MSNRAVVAYRFSFQGRIYILDLQGLTLSVDGQQIRRLNDGSGRNIQPGQLKALKYLLERPNEYHPANLIAVEASPDADNPAEAVSLHIHWLRVVFNDAGRRLIRTRASRPDEDVLAYGLFAEVEPVALAEVKPDEFVASETPAVEPAAPAEGEPAASEPAPPTPRPRRPRLRRVAGAVLLAVCLLCLYLFVRGGLFSAEPRPRQLTTNSAERPVKAAAISPDGSYVAYVEKTGEGEKTNCKLWRRSDGGADALTALRDSEIFRLSWLDADTLLVSGKVGLEETAGIWLVPILGGPAGPSKVLTNQDEVGEAAALDRSHIAFVGGGRNELWLTAAGGQPPRLMLRGERGDEFGGLAWLAGGRRLLFDRLHLAGNIYRVTVETLDVESGQTSVVIANNPRLRAGCASTNGRLYFAVEYEPPDQNDTSIWEMKIDPRSGAVTRAANLLVKSTGATVHGLSTDASGERLVLLKGPYQADVWVGDFDRATGALSASRRLTHDDSNDLPTAWTPDGRAVLFHSNRGGKYAIYKQEPGGAEAERIIYGDEDYRGARVGPGGQLFYLARRGDWQQNKTDSVRLKVSAPDGGGPRVVCEMRALLSVRCPLAGGKPCVMGQRDILSLSDELIFRGLTGDGPGAELRRVKDLPLGREYWDVSPDGSTLAVVIDGAPDATIRVLGLDGMEKDVTVKGRGGFQSLDWAPDGRGWYVSSRSVRSSDLLYVDVDGNDRVLWRSVDGFETWGVPSPDGSHLAILEWTMSGNVWLIDEPPKQSRLGRPLLAIIASVAGISGLGLWFRG